MVSVSLDIVGRSSMRARTRSMHSDNMQGVTFQAVNRRSSGLLRQGLRVARYQQRWKNIKQDLPPQLSRRHIGMISIGGVIGTGLFLGSATALKNGGPVGALLGYLIIGTVVYCLCVSVGEMVAFLPNVGGVVGLADLYVDPAFGFSLGWAAWYNWSVTLPGEITAAAILIQFWDKEPVVPPAVWSAIFLVLATGINCFTSREYGEFEFWFSTIKVTTMVLLILVCLILDLGAGAEGFIGFQNWNEPFGKSYLGIHGGLGRLLGFWAVLMQASFSFFGSEVPGIAAGEVIDATRNVPRALQRVWIRITIFYVGGIFCAGLLVPANDVRLGGSSSDISSSPFVIALNRAGVKILPHIINGSVLLSAWSAAAADIYISSRFLFFLARCRHAPQFLSSLIRHPYMPPHVEAEDELLADEDSDRDVPPVDHITRAMLDIVNDQDSAELIESSLLSATMYSSPQMTRSVPSPQMWEYDGEEMQIDLGQLTLGTHFTVSDVQERDIDLESAGIAPSKEPSFVLPLNSVLVSASVGLLSFLGSTTGSTAETAFSWLMAVASVASLQSWVGFLFTYVRFHQGTMYAEKTHGGQDKPESIKVLSQIEKIREHRHWGQPYLAWYALIVCLIVLFTNGWAVFVHNGWRIADIPGSAVDNADSNADERISEPISMFLSSYIPLPFFLLLTVGYKLICRTKMVRLDEMTFERKDVPEPEEPPETKNRFVKWLLLI